MQQMDFVSHVTVSKGPTMIDTSNRAIFSGYFLLKAVYNSKEI